MSENLVINTHCLTKAFGDVKARKGCKYARGK